MKSKFIIGMAVLSLAANIFAAAPQPALPVEAPKQHDARRDKATGTPDMNHYDDYLQAELKELLTRYGPIGLLWFDGEWEIPWTHDRGVDLYNFCRDLQPDIIINNRVGKARAGMEGMNMGKEHVGDYGTPEQRIPATGFGPGVDWESCMTMNNTWGFRKDDDHWKSTETLIHNIIDCGSKSGNYLLNVGPTGEGLIPDASIERIAEVGAWMKVNGEAIYDSASVICFEIKDKVAKVAAQK